VRGDPHVTVLLGGDVMLGRGVAERARTLGWRRVLADLAAALRPDHDHAIVNLESPLAPCLPGGTVALPRLCGDPAAARALAAAGVTAATLANNHALDAGPAGLAHTVRLLRAAGIAPLGLAAAATGRVRVESLGAIGVLAVNLAPAAHPPASLLRLPSPAEIARAIRAARAADPRRPILVLLHLGAELQVQASERDRFYARSAARAGAAAVVLGGAHVVRELVHEEGVPVHLGLGNLLFDQRDPRTHPGALLRLRLGPKGPAEVIEERSIDLWRAGGQ
jgi:poly-gamma-glutamate capsule biosynthesis protein CapA/YwtB (metallophosphatase superfamily)